jgi:Holliday junction resolvasome RuvABC endonuclease subunit
MIEIPPTHQKLKLIAIDPGLNNVGVAIFVIDLVTKEIESIQALTLRPDRLIDDCPLDEEIHEERLVKRHQIAKAWRSILDTEQPQRVASESPFFDRRKPSSFAILTEVMTTLLDTMLLHNRQLKLHLVPPLKVKQYLGVAGQKGKEPVREAMEKQEKVLKVLQPSIDLLSEHAIDAVGVGLTYLYQFSEIFEEDKKE